MNPSQNMPFFVRTALLFTLLSVSSQLSAQGIADGFRGGVQQRPNSQNLPSSTQIGDSGFLLGPETSDSVAPPQASPLINRSSQTSGFRPGMSDGFENYQLQQQLQQLQRQTLEARNPRNEYQDFILQSTGRELPIFGHDLFRGVPSTFAPVENIPVTADYVIGPGDEVLIRAWGQVDVDFSVTVERNGTISVPKVGVLNVAGIRSQDLTAYLKTSFGRVFRNFELVATLGRLRSIRIFVVGQARRPGSYTVSSVSTLVNAVFAAGGPSSKGSLRGIQLKRGNSVVANLDLYDLLISGDKSKDAQLLPGDVIYFPSVGPLVAVTGSVNVPAIYELRQESPLSDLIGWAGGLATTAQGQKVAVERIENRMVRKMEEFSLDSAGMRRTIRDGDLVTVYALAPRFDNAITLRGNVAQPGRFPWRDGLRVRDLIPDKESVVTRDYWLKRNQMVGLDQGIERLLSAQEVAGTQLGIGDLVQRRERNEQDQTVGDVVRRRQIELEASRLVDPEQRLLLEPQNLEPQNREGGQAAAAGANGSPVGNNRQLQARQKQQPRSISDPTRLMNQIRPQYKEVNWDYAVIERVNPKDLSTALLPFNLGKAILENDPQHNVLLRPGDVVTVFSKDELQVSTARQTKFVRLEGEFVSPGVYQTQPGETLRQLVARVGGFAPGAYIFGSEFTRESTRLQQEKRLDESLALLERDIQRTNITRSQNVSTPEDAASLKQNFDSQLLLANRLRQIRPTGRIVLELPEEARLTTLPDLPLEDADRYYVPPVPSMVSVIGAVYSANSFVYRPEKRGPDYLSQAGGPSKSADKGSIYLLRADGSVVSGRQSGFLLSGFESIRIMPGDSVVVPEELDRTTLTRSLRDISQIFYQFGLGAAALKVLKN